MKTQQRSHPECEPCEREGSGRADLSFPQILWVAEAPRRMTSGGLGETSEVVVLSGGALSRSGGGRAARAGEGWGGGGWREGSVFMTRLFRPPTREGASPGQAPP